MVGKDSFKEFSFSVVEFQRKDLRWSAHTFLLKKRDITKPFSTERNNLIKVSSYRSNGLVHKKTVVIEPTANKKGFNVVMKKSIYAQRSAKNTARVDMKAGPHHSLKKLRNLLTDNKYRKDLI